MFTIINLLMTLNPSITLFYIAFGNSFDKWTTITKAKFLSLWITLSKIQKIHPRYLILIETFVHLIHYKSWPRETMIRDRYLGFHPHRATCLCLWYQKISKIRTRTRIKGGSSPWVKMLSVSKQVKLVEQACGVTLHMPTCLSNTYCKNSKQQFIKDLHFVKHSQYLTITFKMITNPVTPFHLCREIYYRHNF